ncbi:MULTISPECIES: hypothetical protein [unclassified Nocardiopsis]|uniref:hypothetical protein n=1 Tax=Nocardiopsis TaxID=2013 RepID=UPI00387B14D5
MQTPDHGTLPDRGTLSDEPLEIPAGCGYVLVLFAISIVVPLVVGFSLIMSPSDAPTPWGYYAVWALSTLGVVALLLRGSARRWARNGVPRPYARAVLLTAVVAVSYVQSVVTWSFNNDFPLGAFWPAGSTVAVGAVLVMVALARGGRFATLWIVVGLALACTVRAGYDHGRYLEERRQWFDREVAALSEYSHDVLLLDGDRWTATRVHTSRSRVSVGYTGTGPDRVGLEARVDHPDRVDGVPRDPFYDGCRSFAVQCAESEADGRRVLLVRDHERNRGHGPREFVRVRWNSFTFVDIEPEPVLWFRTTDREFFDLARELHVADEADIVALVEEVTGGPRP